MSFIARIFRPSRPAPAPAVRSAPAALQGAVQGGTLAQSVSQDVGSSVADLEKRRQRRGGTLLTGAQGAELGSTAKKTLG